MKRILALIALSSVCAACSETPPAAAPLAAAPHRAGAWQQFCEQAWNVGHASSLAGARGADGWELVAVYNGVLCYKRPMADAGREVRPQLGPSAPVPYVPLVRDPGF